MPKISFITIPVIAVTISLAISFTGNSADNPPEQAKSITVWELQNLQVIGWLGKPLGTIITVEGECVDGSYTNSKGDAGRALLRIETVNGEKLPKEQVFQYPGNDPPRIGTKFKYIGYETGGFTGMPKGAFDYMESVQTTGYYFATSFRILRDEMKQK